MSSDADFLRAQWRRMKRIAVIFPIWIAMIIAVNIWHDADAGKPFNATNFFGGLGIIALGGIVLLGCWLVFKVVLALVSYRDRGK